MSFSGISPRIRQAGGAAPRANDLQLQPSAAGLLKASCSPALQLALWSQGRQGHLFAPSCPTPLHHTPPCSALAKLRPLLLLLPPLSTCSGSGFGSEVHSTLTCYWTSTGHRAESPFLLHPPSGERGEKGL